MLSGALLVPIDPADNGPQVSLVEALEVRKEKDLLLNIRRKIQQFGQGGAPWLFQEGQWPLASRIGSGFDNRKCF
jgi:hypothetical protein